MRASACAAGSAGGGKAWRLSASVVVLAPHKSVPDCEFSDAAVRDAEFDYRVCCVKRAARSSFMPDTMVFPGGVVEAEDVESAAVLLGSERADLNATLRCAAVREAFEESGIGIFQPHLELSREEHVEWRGRVHADPAQFRALCQERDTAPSVQSLDFWCSFITPDVEHAKLAKGGFDARFYVCCASEAQLRWAASDKQETSSLVWMTPGEALAAVAAGRISMVPPQWYILRELADSCPRMAEVRAWAAGPQRALQREYPIKPYPVALPRTEQAALLQRQRGSGAAKAASAGSKEPTAFALCFPGDEAHPVFPGPEGARHRLLMVGVFGGPTAFELQRDTMPQLPLREAQQGWYQLAKL